jgi:hypothetical protein
VELYRSVGAETESEDSDSPKEMVKFHEKTNLEPKRDNSSLLCTSSLSSPNKEIQIQEYNNKDRQHHSDLQHQQEIRSDEFILNSEKDMEIIRSKLILKAVHVLGRINVTTDRLSRLEMSGDYQLRKKYSKEFKECGDAIQE